MLLFRLLLNSRLCSARRQLLSRLTPDSHLDFLHQTLTQLGFLRDQRRLEGALFINALGIDLLLPQLSALGIIIQSHKLGRLGVWLLCLIMVLLWESITISDLFSYQVVVVATWHLSLVRLVDERAFR